jgi:hypothetical protein
MAAHGVASPQVERERNCREQADAFDNYGGRSADVQRSRACADAAEGRRGERLSSRDEWAAAHAAKAAGCAGWGSRAGVWQGRPSGAEWPDERTAHAAKAARRPRSTARIRQGRPGGAEWPREQECGNAGE